MKSLAKGTSSDSIYKLLKVTINTQQQIFAEAMKHTGALEDIADKLETDQPLFDQEETKDGVKYNQKILDGDEKHVP